MYCVLVCANGVRVGLKDFPQLSTFKLNYPKLKSSQRVSMYVISTSGPCTFIKSFEISFPRIVYGTSIRFSCVPTWNHYCIGKILFQRIYGDWYFVLTSQGVLLENADTIHTLFTIFMQNHSRSETSSYICIFIVSLLHCNGYRLFNRRTDDILFFYFTSIWHVYIWTVRSPSHSVFSDNRLKFAANISFVFFSLLNSAYFNIAEAKAIEPIWYTAHQGTT